MKITKESPAKRYGFAAVYVNPCYVHLAGRARSARG